MKENELRNKFKILIDRFVSKTDSKIMLKELNKLFTKWLKEKCEDKSIYKELLDEKQKIYQKLYYSFDDERVQYQKQYNKEYQKANANKLKEYRKIYYRKYRNIKFDENKLYQKQYQKQYKKDNAEKLKEYNKQYYNETKNGRAHMLSNSYKQYDREKGYDESKTVSKSWIIDKIFGGQKCFYCGESDWHKLGCDRIDNSKGHTPDNIVCCCGDCNIKRNRKSFDIFCDLNSVNNFKKKLYKL